MNDQGSILHARAIIRDANHQHRTETLTQKECRKICHVIILALHDDPVLLFQTSSYVANTAVMRIKKKAQLKQFHYCVLTRYISLML